jgi:hypothetical protein
VIRYLYATHLSPPAPFVHVTVSCPSTGRLTASLPAQVDPAADRTVLPGVVVTSLALVEDGRLLIQGFGSQILELPTFLVAVSLHDLSPVLVRAVLGEQEPWILLGRDVLNAHRLLLDGPQLALEIG